MARRDGRLPTPWTVSTPHRPSGISILSNFYDRQVLFTGISAVPAAGNRRRVNLRKKTRERTRPCGASSGFSCLCSSRVSCFRRAALGARLLSLQSHFKWEQAHSAYLSQTGALAGYSLKKRHAGHRRTNLTACAMRVFPRSQAQGLPPRFQRSAHIGSITISIYHNILWMSRYKFYILMIGNKPLDPASSIQRRIRPPVSWSYSWKRQRTSFAGPNPSMLRPQMLRPKYSLSVPCRKIFVHLRLPQERISSDFQNARRR